MISNLTWRQAALSALLMSSAVSANYREQKRSTQGGAVGAVRSVEHADRHVQERNINDEINALISDLTSAGAAAAPAASSAGKKNEINCQSRIFQRSNQTLTRNSITAAPAAAPAAAANGTAAGKFILTKAN